MKKLILFFAMTFIVSFSAFAQIDKNLKITSDRYKDYDIFRVMNNKGQEFAVNSKGEILFSIENFQKYESAVYTIYGKPFIYARINGENVFFHKNQIVKEVNGKKISEISYDDIEYVGGLNFTEDDYTEVESSFEE